MDWQTTTTLLHDLRDYANASAWDRFASRFRRPIVRFARDLGLSAADADDVAQEALIAFAEAYRAGRYDRDKGRLSKWLFGITYRQALNQRRAVGRRERKLTPAAGKTTLLATLPSECDASCCWDRQWEMALLKECLDRVRSEVDPVTFRSFDLVVRLSLKPAEAAEQLAVPVKAVYNAKHRVLKRIRELRAQLDDMPSDDDDAVPSD